jgi:hypothetical protein
MDEQRSQPNVVWLSALGVVLLVLGAWMVLLRHGAGPGQQLFLGAGLLFGTLLAAIRTEGGPQSHARDLILLAHGGFSVMFVSLLIGRFGFSGSPALLFLFLALVAAPGALFGRLSLLSDLFLFMVFLCVQQMLASSGLGKGLAPGGGFQSWFGVLALLAIAASRGLSAGQGKSGLSVALSRWGWLLVGLVFLISMAHTTLLKPEPLTSLGWFAATFFVGLAFRLRELLLSERPLKAERWAFWLGLGVPLFVMLSSGNLPTLLRHVLGFVGVSMFLFSLMAALQARGRVSGARLVGALLTLRFLFFIQEMGERPDAWGSTALLICGGFMLFMSFAWRSLLAGPEAEAAPAPAPAPSEGLSAALGIPGDGQRRALVFLLLFEALVFGFWTWRAQDPEPPAPVIETCASSDAA